MAIGGGSPLDVGKIIRLKARPGVHERPLVDYDDATGGDAFITANVPPMLALPTTAGTGSEVGRSGVVTLDANRRKTVIFSPHFMANAAILDPELSVSMPARTTAATGFDALTHCLEAYVSLGDHPMADSIALGGLRLVAEHLERAVTQAERSRGARGHDEGGHDGRRRFSKRARSVPFARPPALQSVRPSPRPCQRALPRRPSSNSTPRSRGRGSLTAAQALGADPSPRGLASRLRELQRTLGLPVSLSAAGVKADQLAPLADGALADACHRCNPRPCNRADLLGLYRASF